MDLIFNELSLKNPALNNHEAIKRMTEFIKLAQEVIRCGANRTLRTTINFISSSLSPDYMISKWINDTNVDQMERQFIKTIISKGPYLDRILSNEEHNREAAFEFFCDEDIALGLGIAYLWESPALSIAGNPRFDSDPVSIKMLFMENRGETIEAEDIDVCCLSKVNQIANRLEWIRIRALNAQSIKTGADLWDRLDEIFPRLIFCPSTEKQLKGFNGKEPFFWQIWRHLITINNYLEKWTGGPFALQGISWSDESPETLNNPTYSKLRQFQLPNDEIRLFRFHTKPTGGNIRIYFLPDIDIQSAYIGYIGHHLPTVFHN